MLSSLKRANELYCSANFSSNIASKCCRSVASRSSSARDTIDLTYAIHASGVIANAYALFKRKARQKLSNLVAGSVGLIVQHHSYYVSQCTARINHVAVLPLNSNKRLAQACSISKRNCPDCLHTGRGHTCSMVNKTSCSGFLGDGRRKYGELLFSCSSLYRNRARFNVLPSMYFSTGSVGNQCRKSNVVPIM